MNWGYFITVLVALIVVAAISRVVIIRHGDQDPDSVRDSSEVPWEEEE